MSSPNELRQALRARLIAAAGLLESGNPERARREVEAALGLDSGYAPALALLAQIEEAQARNQGAADQGRAPRPVLGGLAETPRADHTRTREWYAFERRMRQRRAARYAARARMALEDGRTAEARAALEELRSLDPASPLLSLVLASDGVPAPASNDARATPARPRVVSGRQRRRAPGVWRAPLGVTAALVMAAAGVWIVLPLALTALPATPPLRVAEQFREVLSSAHVNLPAVPGAPAALPGPAALRPPIRDPRYLPAGPVPVAETRAEPPERPEPRPAPAAGQARAAAIERPPVPAAVREPTARSRSPIAERRTPPAPTTAPRRLPVAAGPPADALPPASEPPAMTTAPVARAAESAHPPVSPETGVQRTLQRYRRAYGDLDASAAKEVWPSVDERALARAFGSLESQRIAFDGCQVRVRGTTASASCNGWASYVPKIGRRALQIERRRWTFTLRQVGGDWQIEAAEAER